VNIIKFYKKISYLISKKQLYGCFFLCLFSVIIAFMEIIGLSLIFPIINLLLDSSSYIKIKHLNILYEQLNFEDSKKFSIFILTSFIIIYILKLILILIFRIFQHNLTYNIQVSTAVGICKKLLDNNYYYFIKTKSSKFVASILNESEIFANGVISSFMTFISELVVLFTIIVFLFLYDFQNTFIILIFFSVFFLIYSLILQNKLKTLGDVRQESQKKMYENLLSTFSAIKIIKLNKKEPLILSRFESSIKNYSGVSRKAGILSSIPRVALEFIAILSFFIICIYGYSRYVNLSEFFATIALYAAASLKLIPSLSKIIHEFQSIRINIPAVNTLYKTTKDKIFESPKTINLNHELYKFEKNISFVNINFQFDRGVKVLNNLNFELQKNETVGIFGKSGSGKSTFIDLFLGFLDKDTGLTNIDGNKVNLNSNNWKDLIGYLPQNIFLFNESIEKNVSLVLNDNSLLKENFNFAIKFAQLENTINNLPKKEKTNVGENGIFLSGGEKQRVAIARALYKKPKILVFDEPTSSVDKKTEKQFIQGIKKLKKDFTIIIVTHSLDLLKLCDNIFEMENGKLNLKSITGKKK
jgi:ATP-binding cassette, subfamily B, bacterial PglK